MKLQLYPNIEDEQLIRKGCKIAGLKLSPFLKTASILYARKLIRESEVKNE